MLSGILQHFDLHFKCCPAAKPGCTQELATTVQIPRVEARLSTFLTRFEARQQLAEAKGILEGHQAAHRELKGSPCMAAALQETLAIGNFLNWGTRLGPAAGFRLRNLPKLQVLHAAHCYGSGLYICCHACFW